MTKQKISAIILAILAVFGIGSYQLGGLGDSTAKYSDVGSMGTSGAMYLAANTSTQMISTSSTREILRISNLASNPIYCNANGDKAAVGYLGIMIAASSTLTFDSEFPYVGAVRCISPFGAASTTVYARQGN